MSSQQSKEPTAERTLHRVLGLHHVVASGVAIIIGAGIFVLLAPAAQLAGSQVWVSFLVAALLCTCTALSYAELASMFPKSGGEFEFSKAAFPPWITFMTFWLNFTSLIIAAATVALGFAGYLHRFIQVNSHLGAVLMVTVTLGIALSGIQWSGRVVAFTALIQGGALLLVTFFGLTAQSEYSLTHSHGANGILAGAALVFFAYIGFDEVTTLAEETKNPTRTIPLALLLSLAISTVLYIAVSIAAVRLIGPDRLAQSNQPMAEVMTGIWGSNGAVLLSLIALFTTFDTTLLAVQSATRVLYGWARDAANFVPLQRISRRGIPWVAVLITASLALAITAVGDLQIIAGLTDFAVFLVFIVVNAAAIRLRYLHPDLHRPFRVPGSFGRFPLLPLLGLILTAIMLPRLSTPTLIAGSALVGTGLFIYWLVPQVGRSLNSMDTH